MRIRNTFSFSVKKMKYMCRYGEQQLRPLSTTQVRRQQLTAHPIFTLPCTVPTFDSSTECVGGPGIIHNRIPNYHQVSWECMLRWPHNWAYLWFGGYMCHGCAWHIFWYVNRRCLYIQAQADVWSTGAGIKCMYCRSPPTTLSRQATWVCFHFFAGYVPIAGLSRTNVRRQGVDSNNNLLPSTNPIFTCKNPSMHSTFQKKNMYVVL